MSKKLSTYAPGIYITEKDAKGTRISEISIKTDRFVEFLNKNTDAKGYVKISFWPKREPDKFGTHNAILNEWRPEGYSSSKQDPYNSPKEGADDLPF